MFTKGLRILMVTTFYPPYSFGGDALYVEQLVRVLTGRGHEVDVVHNVDAYTVLSKSRNSSRAVNNTFGEVYSLDSGFPFVSLLLSQQSGTPGLYASRLQQILEENKYDVIHYHNISLMGGPSVLRLGNAIKLYTAHEHWLVCPTHVLWRHNRELCTKRECLRCVVRYKRPPQVWRYSRLLPSCSKHVDQFIALSEFSADKHREFGFEPDMHVMPSFIAETRQSGDHREPCAKEDQSARPETADSSDRTVHKTNEPVTATVLDEPYFLFVGRLELIKGLQDVIPLFKKGIGAKLLIAGTGDHEPTLKTMAQDCADIVFLGHVDSASLAAWYENSLAVVLPSVCYEVFPLVVLEAFKHGAPVIARAFGPFPEIVRKSGAGLLFESEQELEEALARFVQSNEMRLLLSAAATQAFQSLWSEKCAMSDYFELLRDIADRRGDARVQAVLDHCSTDGYLQEPVA